MRFLNWIIETIDKESEDTHDPQTVYERFYDDASKLFENVFDEEWMNLKAEESAAMSSSHLKRRQSLIEADDRPAKTEAELEKYRAQVKEYTSYIIGRKISKNVAPYSE